MSTQKPQASNILTSILDHNRLTGPNLSDWLRNLKLVLNLEHMGYVLNSKIPGPLPLGTTPEELETLEKWKEHDMRARCYMLASMTNELQKQHENMQNANEILLHLQELYGEHSRNARYEISRQLFRMRISEVLNVGDHVHKMIQLIE
ncbi:hypothetical protein P3X46_022657 [Hevea brasiliensis]|uniref:UBN2_3 domain-containing protein n=1 Tax=Hevea brasiliensis TaxID=3981 RepID=A0ABQ9L8H7_HEVBR|nr:hypothetical protein P3X46_022657 [Hevea brasiliensis]